MTRRLFTVSKLFLKKILQTYLLNLPYQNGIHQHHLFHNTKCIDIFQANIQKIYNLEVLYNLTHKYSKPYYIKTKQQQFCRKKLTPNHQTKQNTLSGTVNHLCATLFLKWLGEVGERSAFTTYPGSHILRNFYFQYKHLKRLNF